MTSLPFDLDKSTTSGNFYGYKTGSMVFNNSNNTQSQRGSAVVKRSLFRQQKSDSKTNLLMFQKDARNLLMPQQNAAVFGANNTNRSPLDYPMISKQYSRDTAVGAVSAIQSPSPPQNQFQSQNGLRQGDTLNQKLEDIFYNEANTSGKRSGNNNFIPQNGSTLIKVNGIDLDVAYLSEAVKIVKLRFFYEVLVKQAVSQFPECLQFMILKAFISLDLFNNKYLALTAITHVSTISQVKHNYRAQIQSLISVNYFLKAILSKTGHHKSSQRSGQLNRKKNLGGSSAHSSFNDESGLHFSSNNSSLKQSELDSTILLEQTLKIDEIINCIKHCTFKIVQFWQIAMSENASAEMVQQLQSLTLEISEMLRKIRMFVKQMESIDSFQSTCQTLATYLSLFFIQVIRDRSLGFQITRQIINIGTLGSRAQQRQNLVDEVGVIVVDGNFSLYGRVLFANKIVTKLLGYQSTDLPGKLIHALMPSAVAEVHNIFWTSFSQVGVPKVLDQLRHLFVKDSKGYISPFKIFIKFQFSPIHGYSFVGLLRKPTKVVFDDQLPPIRLRKTYQMICNSNGKILEISPNCRQLFKLTPQILENLHGSLQENFQLQFFNPNLALGPNSTLNFSRHSCVFFKYMTLNLSNLKQLANNFEIDYDGNDHIAIHGEDDTEEGDLFANLKSNFVCSMKIIQENYGSKASTQLMLYYVIFTELTPSQLVEGTSSNLQNLPSNAQMMISGLSLSASQQLIAYSAIQGGQPNNNIRDNSQVEKTQHDLYGLDMADRSLSDDGDYLNHSGGHRSQSHEESLMNTASVSSTASSKTGSQTETEIKYVEEGIDYDKLPKPLLFLKLSTVFLFLSLIILASIQYSLNKNYEQDNLKFQKVLVRSIFSQELITQLSLMLRTSVNIGLNLEPNSNDFISDRKATLKNNSLHYIETIRGNMQYLHHFFNTEKIRGGDSNNDGIDEQQQLNFKNVTIYSILADATLQATRSSRFTALNTWIVSAYEAFINDKFTSKLGTFLSANQELNGKITNDDQTLFFVLTNALNDMLYQLQLFINTAEGLIVEQVSYSIEMNKYYVAITSVLTLALMIGSLYFFAVVLRFKNRVLAFFAELDLQSISISEKTAREFYYFLVTDDNQLLSKSRRELDDYYVKKFFEDGNFQQASYLGLGQHFSSVPELQNNNHNIVGDFTDSLQKSKNHSDHSNCDDQEENKSSLSENDEENIEEEEKENANDDETPKDKKAKEKKQKKHQKKKSKKKKHNSKKKKGDLDQQSQIYKNNEMTLGQLSSSIKDSAFIKNTVIASRLHEVTMKRMTNISILGIIISILFVAYFVVQYLIFSKDEMLIKSNSQDMRRLIESMQCTNSFLLNVRTLQVSNLTQYDISPSQIGKPLHTISSQDLINNLNTSYYECIFKNQQVNQWLQVYSEGEFHIDNSNNNSASTNSANLCQFPTSQSLNITSCEAIYQGILQKSILQSTSVFLQDTLYQVIRFVAPTNAPQRKDPNFIKDTLTTSVELLDAHSFFQQVALREYYSNIIVRVMENHSQQAFTALFIIFMAVLTIGFVVIVCVVIQKIKLEFWQSFYILRLIPKDDIDKEFVKRLNDYLSKA